LIFTHPYRDGSILKSTYQIRSEKLKGITTTERRAEGFNELLLFMEDMEQNSHLITFGSVPILNYLLDVPPLFETSWSDLNSYSIDDYKETLESHKESNVYIVISKLNGQVRWDKDNPEVLINYLQKNTKGEVLSQYINDNKMSIIYSSDYFMIYK